MAKARALPVKVAIVVPSIMFLVVIAGVILWLASQYLDRQRLLDAEHRSEIIAYAVQYAAEVAGSSPELNRIVQALGTESGVKHIYVASIDENKVIASNQFALRDKPLDTLNFGELHARAIASFQQGQGQDIATIQTDNLTYTYISFFFYC